MIQHIINKNETASPVSREMAGLKEYFPQCFNSQGEFDIDKFREAIQPQVDVTREGRSYDFLGKSYARMLSSLDTTTVIRPDTEHNAKPENANSENIYISGDNLDALHHLTKSYASILIRLTIQEKTGLHTMISLHFQWKNWKRN